MFHSKPPVPMYCVVVSSMYIVPMSSMLPIRRRVKEGMLLAIIVCRRLAGRNALSWKIVSAVGVPPKLPRGVLYWWMWVRPWRNWANNLKPSATSKSV